MIGKIQPFSREHAKERIFLCITEEDVKLATERSKYFSRSNRSNITPSNICRDRTCDFSKYPNGVMLAPSERLKKEEMMWYTYKTFRPGKYMVYIFPYQPIPPLLTL